MGAEFRRTTSSRAHRSASAGDRCKWPHTSLLAALPHRFCSRPFPGACPLMRWGYLPAVHLASPPRRGLEALSSRCGPSRHIASFCLPTTPATGYGRAKGPFSPAVRASRADKIVFPGSARPPASTRLPGQPRAPTRYEGCSVTPAAPCPAAAGRRPSRRSWPARVSPPGRRRYPGCSGAGGHRVGGERVTGEQGAQCFQVQRGAAGDMAGSQDDPRAPRNPQHRPVAEGRHLLQLGSAQAAVQQREPQKPSKGPSLTGRSPFAGFGTSPRARAASA